MLKHTYISLQKEKDLELTARIGKELLQTNAKLENTVASLEHDLRAAHEKITQLSHETQKKTELIQILTNDMDETCLENGSPTGKINFELLQKRVCKYPLLTLLYDIYNTTFGLFLLLTYGCLERFSI